MLFPSRHLSSKNEISRLDDKTSICTLAYMFESSIS